MKCFNFPSGQAGMLPVQWPADVWPKRRGGPRRVDFGSVPQTPVPVLESVSQLHGVLSASHRQNWFACSSRVWGDCFSVKPKHEGGGMSEGLLI